MFLTTTRWRLCTPWPKTSLTTHIPVNHATTLLTGSIRNSTRWLDPTSNTSTSPECHQTSERAHHEEIDLFNVDCCTRTQNGTTGTYELLTELRDRSSQSRSRATLLPREPRRLPDQDWRRDRPARRDLCDARRDLCDARRDLCDFSLREGCTLALVCVALVNAWVLGVLCVSESVVCLVVCV